MRTFFLKAPTVKFFRDTLPGIIRDTAKQMEQAQLFTYASSLAYTTILSIIPLLAVSFAVFQAFGGLQKLYSIIKPMILSNLAEGASEQVIESLQSFIENAHTGAIGVGGMVGLIFTSMSMLSSAENAINYVWQVKMTRSLFQRIAYYWLFITLGPLTLSIAVGIATSSNIPLVKLLPSGIGMYFITVGIFFLVYKFVPQVKVQWQYALTSSIITSLFWNLARWGYALYTKHAVTYNVVYGSLGAIPIFLLWIYIIWLVLLGGASLTAALQNRMERQLRSARESLALESE